MSDQNDLQSTLGLHRRSSQWPFFHRQLVTNRPPNLPSSWWPNIGWSRQIIDNKTGRSAVRCLFAPETSLHFTGQIGNSCIKMKFQVWRSITTDQFILCIVFCEEINWIDAPMLIYSRTYFDSRWYGRYVWYRWHDDVYWLRRPLAVHAG